MSLIEIELLIIPVRILEDHVLKVISIDSQRLRPAQATPPQFAEGPATGGDLTRTLTEGATRKGVIIGTIAYMSPEQASGKTLDARSDIFSFGVVLYEMFSGRRPFGGATDLEVLKTIIHAELPPLLAFIPSCQLFCNRSHPEANFAPAIRRNTG